jgi:3alpha(or 20beta)-hydroxysteroid dehydrogenase
MEVSLAGVLEGRVAIVTGAARGQGEAIARIFAAEGAHVILGDVDESAGRAAAAQIGDRAIFERLDIAERADWERLVGGCLDRHGRLDVLVNNAAIYDWLTIEDTTDEVFERFFRVNQFGTFLGMKVAIEPMKKTKGSIINIASVGGTGGYPGILAYATSKWAIRGMTKCAARDLGRYGIRVNSILPGVIETNMVAHLPAETKQGWLASMPLGRLGEPDDVARVALFLASDASSYMTGTDVVVDAGMIA